MNRLEQIKDGATNEWFKKVSRRYLPVPAELIVGWAGLLFLYLGHLATNFSGAISYWRQYSEEDDHEKNGSPSAGGRDILESGSDAESGSEVPRDLIKGTDEG